MARRDVSTSAMDAYMDNIGKIPLMTPEEEILLGKQVRRMMDLKKLDRELTRKEKREVLMGERAKNRFVQANLRLVVYIVRRNNRRSSFLEHLDLIQECTIGLIRAVEMFDPQRGYKFSTYAYWWCRQAINRTYTAQDRAIRRPVSVGEMAAKVEKIFNVETERLGRAPTLDELSEASGIKRSELELLATRGSHCVSLDVLAAGDNSSTFLEILPDDRNPSGDELLEEMDLSTDIERMMSQLHRLTAQERRFVIRRYGLDGGEPAILASLGKEMGVTRERARQVIAAALVKLRLYMADSQEQEHEQIIEPPAAPPKATRRSRKPVPRKCDLIDPEVLREAREAWSSPALQSA